MLRRKPEGSAQPRLEILLCPCAPAAAAAAPGQAPPAGGTPTALQPETAASQCTGSASAGRFSASPAVTAAVSLAAHVTAAGGAAALAANGVPPFGKLCDGAGEAGVAACEADLSRGPSGRPNGSLAGRTTGSLTRSPTDGSSGGAWGGSAPGRALPPGVGALVTQHSLQLHLVQVRACRPSVLIPRSAATRFCWQNGPLIILGRRQGRDAITPRFLRKMKRVLSGCQAKATRQNLQWSRNAYGTRALQEPDGAASVTGSVPALWLDCQF